MVSGALGGIGRDPLFSPKSSLYNPGVARRPDDYYNTSAGSPDVSPFGLPYAFQHEPLPGYPDGYPVWISNDLPAGRINDMLTYLSDGGYLSQQTEKLTAEMFLYNPQLSVFGYASLLFEWQPTGSIQGKVEVQGLPAVELQVRMGDGAVCIAALLMLILAAVLAFRLHE